MSDTATTPSVKTEPATPVSTQRLKQIANDACNLALEKTEGYDHSRTEAWNNQIINHIIRALVSESTPAGASSAPWKFCVNSTIIQHLSSKAVSGSTGEGTELVNGKAETNASKGRRGMHSACGAYWNKEKDGMWSFKLDTKGMDVVISVMWIAV